ncbi:MAG: hypothetical protein ABIA62_04090 [Candidatus Woesearchaeota archaeon]
MAKVKDETLKRLKKIQDMDDEDSLLDVTKSHKVKHAVHPIHKVQHVHDVTDEQETPVKESEEQTKKDTKNLLIAIGIVAAIFIIFFLLIFAGNKTKRELTIDELHDLNLQGKLDPDQGYLYHGYSFIKFAGIWHSQVQKGNSVYDVTFNNDPKSVEDVPLEGLLSSRFDPGNKIYITFDTDALYPKYLAVANAGISLTLAKGFQYQLTATCTNNESSLCQKNGVVTCDDTDKSVIYLKEAPEAKVVLSDTCITIQGMGEEIVRAKDRLLLSWYGIVE